MRPLPWLFITGATALVQSMGAGEIDVDDLRPFLVGEIFEISEGDRLVVGRIVDQDVEPAEALDDIVDQALHFGAPGHVTGEGGSGNLVLFEIARDPGRLFPATSVDDRDVTALRSEGVANALAEPAIAAGDDGHLAFQVHSCPQIGLDGCDDEGATISFCRDDTSVGGTGGSPRDGPASRHPQAARHFRGSPRFGPESIDLAGAVAIIIA
ncbi:MAG: hypothetical protein Q8M19_27425 [Reyranella sp.]|nr:hypothetical protein [Reyranella sp.]